MLERWDGFVRAVEREVSSEVNKMYALEAGEQLAIDQQRRHGGRERCRSGNKGRDRRFDSAEE